MADSMTAELDALAEDFDVLEDWQDQMQHVIDLGKALPELPEADRTDANKVRGCASQVWLVSEAGDDGRLHLRGDSDAHIVRGLVAIVLRLADGRPAGEIAVFDWSAAFARLNLSGHLSAQRANGLASMVRRIQTDAAAAG